MNFWEHLSARRDIVNRLKKRNRRWRSLEREAAEEIEFLRLEVEFQKSEARLILNKLMFLRQAALDYMNEVEGRSEGEEK